MIREGKCKEKIQTGEGSRDEDLVSFEKVQGSYLSSLPWALAASDLLSQKKNVTLACLNRSTMPRPKEKSVSPVFPAQLWTGRCLGRALANQVVFRGLQQPQNVKKEQGEHLPASETRPGGWRAQQNSVWLMGVSRV